MHACDLYYEVCLPNVFKLNYTVGSVVGCSIYGNGFELGQSPNLIIKRL